MGRLYEALQAYETAIADLGFDFFGTMRRGRDRDEVDARLRDEGIESIDELVDWFSFGDGLLPSIPGKTRIAGLFGYVSLTLLEDSLAERRRRLDPDFFIKNGFTVEQYEELEEADLLTHFQPSWVPISRGKQTCVVDTGIATPDRRRLFALWNDELPPRRMADNMVSWVNGLMTEINDLRERPAGDAGPVGAGFFELGSVSMTDRRAGRLTSLVGNPFLGRCDRLRLCHATVGSLAGNKGLEFKQVSELERELRAIGFADWNIETVAGEPSIDHLHEIAIFGVLPSALS